MGDKEEKLKQANIPESWWGLCKVENNIIYTPSIETLHKHGLVTEEEYKLWKTQCKQIDICTEPTAEERIKQLEQDKEDLAANVYMLAEIIETLLGGVEDGQEGTTTEVTTD